MRRENNYVFGLGNERLNEKEKLMFGTFNPEIIPQIKRRASDYAPTANIIGSNNYNNLRQENQTQNANSFNQFTNEQTYLTKNYPTKVEVDEH